MPALRAHLERLDRRRATVWADALEHEFPGIGEQPDRVQGLVALEPYRNPRPRPAVAVVVDGSAYVMVDGRPNVFPVLSHNLYALNGRNVRVLSIPSHDGRRYYPTHVDGWTEPDTLVSVLQGCAPPANDNWWPAERATTHGTSDKRFPLVRKEWFHVAIWASAVLVIWGSALSEPTGSPVAQLIERLLMLACFGLFVASASALVVWLRQGRS
ncbi:hypothetical protein AFL01nite_02850 [Aeromicrobium flavum]|uniref:Uncharacterized protein n=1 Tax=Aeromicrobium flavum TaxID=416568 RepID=A0A512HR89_9ACTN|nr:hypothetical protein AFL01nite_02850 [Aeromicrobium flavum]